MYLADMTHLANDNMISESRHPNQYVDTITGTVLHYSQIPLMCERVAWGLYRAVYPA